MSLRSSIICLLLSTCPFDAEVAIAQSQKTVRSKKSTVSKSLKAQSLNASSNSRNSKRGAVGAQERIKSLPETDAAKAQEYYLLKRATGPDRRIPAERYSQALKQSQKLPVHSTAARVRSAQTSAHREDSSAGITAGLDTWTWLGPGNIGGRARALVIDPSNSSIMYTAGVAGGVWKTTSAGSAWLPISDAMANFAVTTLALDPHNSQIIYAGTGEGFGNGDSIRGSGIFRSNDAGTNWAQLTPFTSDWFYVNKIVVSTRDSNTIYAATNSGIFRSNNGGTTFSNIYQGNCPDLAIRTDLPNQDYLFASCQVFGYEQVVRTIDGSQTAPVWNGVLGGSAMARTSLAIAPSNQNVIYALTSRKYAPLQDSLEGVYRSDNSGDSFTKINSGTNSTKLNTVLLSNPLIAFNSECGQGKSSYLGQGWYDNVIAVDPTNANRVWVGGIDLFRSDDGGANWGLASYWWGKGYSSYVHADQHAISFHPGYNGTTNRTLFVANDGGVFRTDDALAQTASGTTAACSPNNTAAQWTSLNNNLGITQFYNGTPFPSGTQYFGGTQDNGTILGGDSNGSGQWSQLLGGDGGYVAIDSSSPNKLYAENPGLFIKKSNDGGQTWNLAVNGIDDEGLFVTPFFLDPVDGARLWTGGVYMWRSDNAALVWQQASAITPGNGLVSAIGVSPINSNNVVAGLSDGFIVNTQSGNTNNAATAWSYSFPRAGFVSSVTFDRNDPNTVYATYSSFNYYSTDGHVYKSTDAGHSWQKLDGTSEYALPDVPVHSLVINPFIASELYIGTDIGVFVSLDGGLTWNRENTGFVNVVTESLGINVQGNTANLFAFTHGRGVWRVPIKALGLSVSPILMDFGQQATGGTSSARAFVVTNTTDAPITVAGIDITGEFSQTNTCGTIAAGGTCQIEVTFSPTSDGLKNGTVTIAHSGSNSPFTVQLRGTGFTGPIIQLSTATMDFGSIEVNRSSSTKLVTLKNIGNATLNDVSIVVNRDAINPYTSADFFAGTECPIGTPGLAPGGSCNIRLRFMPTATGSLSALLRVSGVRTRDRDCSTCIFSQVSLTGTGAPLTVAITTLDPSSLRVGSPSKEIKISGSGFSPLSQITVNGSQHQVRFESSSVIYFTLNSAELVRPQLVDIQVDTPSIGASLPRQLPIFVSLTGSDLVYDRYTRNLYGFNAFGSTTSLISIDPISGNMTRLTDVDQYNGALTIAPDGRYLYFSTYHYPNFSQKMARFNIELGIVEKLFVLESVTYPQAGFPPPVGTAPIGTIFVLPTDSRDLVISKANGGLNYGISLYKDGILQGQSIEGTGTEFFASQPNSSFIYNYSYFHPFRVIQAFDSKGLGIVLQQPNPSNYALNFKLGASTIYMDGGDVLDSQSMSWKGRYTGFGISSLGAVQPDEGDGKTYFVASDTLGYTQFIAAFDMNTFDQISASNFLGQFENPQSFILWGRSGAVFYTNYYRAYIFKRPGSTDPSANQPTPQLNNISPASAPQRGHNFELRLVGSNFNRWSVVRWNGLDLDSQFIDSNTLVAYVPHAKLSSIGTAPITIFNPPDGGSSQALPFAIQVAEVGTSSDAIDFGQVLVGHHRESTWTLTNNTGLPLTIGAVSLPSTAFHESHSCASVLNPGSSCTFSVDYAPMQTVPEFTALKVESASISAPIQVPVLGSGFDFMITMARPTRPSRNASSALIASSAFKVNLTGTPGVTVTLKCEVSNPAMTCKLPTPKIVIGPDGSNTLVNLYATGTRARRLQQARGVDSSYTVRVTASANGESKTVLESF